MGFYPVSFEVDRKSISRSGLQMNISRVRNLPGAPDHETVSFVVSCDPRGANIDVGTIETIAILNVLLPYYPVNFLHVVDLCNSMSYL